MSDIKARLNEYFPAVEVFADCTGVERRFELRWQSGVCGGYVIHARDLTPESQKSVVGCPVVTSHGEKRLRP